MFSAQAKNISGKAPSLDYGKTNEFKEQYRNLILQLCALDITPDVFCQQLDAAAEEDSRQEM